MRTFISLSIILSFFDNYGQSNNYQYDTAKIINQTDSLPLYTYLDVVDWKRKPIVRGKLNGKECFLLVDTGSDITIFHIGDSKKINFKYKRYGTKNLAFESIEGKNHDLMRAYDLQLYLGNMEIHSKYFAYEMSNIINSLEYRVGIKISGIIGSDVMRTYGVLIDYEHKIVRIGRPLWEKDLD